MDDKPEQLPLPERPWRCDLCDQEIEPATVDLSKQFPRCPFCGWAMDRPEWLKWAGL